MKKYDKPASNVSLNKEQHQRLKIYCSENYLKMYKVMELLIDSYLDDATIRKLVDKRKQNNLKD